MKKVGLVFQETARGLQGVWHWSFLVPDPPKNLSRLVSNLPAAKNTRNAVLLIFVPSLAKILKISFFAI